MNRLSEADRIAKAGASSRTPKPQAPTASLLRAQTEGGLYMNLRHSTFNHPCLSSPISCSPPATSHSPLTLVISTHVQKREKIVGAPTFSHPTQIPTNEPPKKLARNDMMPAVGSFT
jgi:hypothetical protein